MSDTIILNGLVKYRGKETEWEFHQVLAPVGFKWYGRKAGEDKPVVTLTGLKLKAAEAAYVRHLEQHQGVPPPPVPEEVEEPEFDAGNEEPLHDDITKDSIIEPIMYREDILGPKPAYRTLQRHHVGDARYYVQQFRDAEGNWSKPKLYPGVTSVCGAMMPESKILRKWWCAFPSYELAEAELDKLAAKGTVMHSLFAMCMNGELPDFGTSEFERLLRGLIANQRIDVDSVIGEWRGFMCKALLGFKQFCYDHNVEVLAIEIVLCEPDVDYGDSVLRGYSMQVDLLCYMDYQIKGEWGEVYKSGPNKDKPKVTSKTVRVLADVDFKSGSSNLPDHIMQLMLHRPAIKRAFPHLDTKDMRLFNWHPKDFRTSTLSKIDADEDNDDELEFGYTLIDQTDKKPQSWAIDALRYWQKHLAKRLPKKAVYKGSPNISTRPSENMAFVDYETFWENKIERSRAHKFADL